MKGERKMYCESWADKKWMAMVERRGKREEARIKAKEKDKDDQSKLFTKTTIEDLDLEEVTVTLDEAGDKDVDFDAGEEGFDEENNVGQTKKRKRRTLNSERKQRVSKICLKTGSTSGTVYGR